MNLGDKRRLDTAKAMRGMRINAAALEQRRNWVPMKVPIHRKKPHPSVLSDADCDRLLDGPEVEG